MTTAHPSSKFWITLGCLAVLISLLPVTAQQTAAGDDSDQPPLEPLVTQQLGYPGPDSEEPVLPNHGPDPDLEPGFPVQAYHGTGTYHAGVAIHTLVGNIDSDPTLEILVTALSQGPLYAWNADGSLVPGWPVSSVSGAGYMALGELSVSQPGLEVFVGTLAGGASNADKVAALTGGGAFLTGWPRTAANYVSTPPALADVDGDGLDEIFVGEDNYYLYAYEPNSVQLPNWPRNGGGAQDRHTSAIADLDQDGDLEIIMGTGPATSGVWVHAWHHDGTGVTGWPLSFPEYGHPDTFIAVGDVDGDGEWEVVFIAKGKVRVVSAGGLIELELSQSASAAGMAPALADLDGDSFPEIIIQSSNNIP